MTQSAKRYTVVEIYRRLDTAWYYSQFSNHPVAAEPYPSVEVTVCETNNLWWAKFRANSRARSSMNYVVVRVSETGDVVKSYEYTYDFPGS